MTPRHWFQSHTKLATKNRLSLSRSTHPNMTVMSVLTSHHTISIYTRPAANMSKYDLHLYLLPAFHTHAPISTKTSPPHGEYHPQCISGSPTTGRHTVFCSRTDHGTTHKTHHQRNYPTATVHSECYSCTKSCQLQPIRPGQCRCGEV